MEFRALKISLTTFINIEYLGIFMPKSNHQEKCQVCGSVKKIHDLTPAEVIRPSITYLIKKEHADWDVKGFVCHDDLNHYRGEYVREVLEKQKGEFSTLERDVVRSMKAHELLAKNINAEFEKKATVGEKAADKIAEFGGSWSFVIFFMVVIVIWISLNVSQLMMKPFDPFPFILLNLILSCLAALQAPIIMMSQNRMEARDRMRSENDYRINLKAELEIRHLHEKMDHLLRHQWQRLLEVQQIQTELMEELIARKT